MIYRFCESAVGILMLAGDESGALEWIAFAAGKHPVNPKSGWVADRHAFPEAVRQLESYFAGELTHFQLKLHPRGTPFQMTVWRALAEIPYGETLSYSDLARRVGMPKAVRAAGAANGRNPLSIVIPCHRVIGSNGSLTGYGGGIEIKKRLLDLERSVCVLKGVPSARSALKY
jgi:methylated-DNA-[protein]-cysteine S-methyltransferase